MCLLEGRDGVVSLEEEVCVWRRYVDDKKKEEGKVGMCFREGEMGMSSM